MDKYSGSTLTEVEAKTLYENLTIVRKAKRATVTKTINRLRGLTLNKTDAAFYSRKLELYAKELKDMHAELGSLSLKFKLWNADEYENQNDKVEEYDDGIQLAIFEIRPIIDSTVPQTDDLNPYAGEAKFSLPKLELPKFSGLPEEYNKFIMIFESMTSKNKLSEYEKFIYLQRQLSGNARSLLDTIPVSELTYTNAKKLLNEAFCCKIDQQYAIIGKMSKMKLNLSDDPYKWICQAKVLKDQIDNLEIDTDLILQYFLWDGLNDSFKAQYVGITNSSKPTLKQILDNAFEANRRYAEFGLKNLKQKSESKSSEEKYLNHTVAFANQVNKSLENRKEVFVRNSCCLCFADNLKSVNTHKLYQCTVYSDPISKINKLRELHGCTKCGFTNHLTEDCLYKFRYLCSNCNDQHHTCLCPNTERRETESSATINSKQKTVKNVNKKSGSKFADQKSTINQLVQFTIQNEEFEKIILPTFTVEIDTNTKKNRTIRALWDTASQSSFILKNLAHQLKLKVIKPNLTITVFGFNETKTYNTDLVALDLIIDENCHTIHAICIPCIRTDINIPEISDIVNEFQKKGYKMADKKLKGERCNNIELLIGMDNGSILLNRSISYGHEPSTSIYLDTILGVILLGDVPKMLKNIQQLPVCHSSDSGEQ